MASAPKPPPPFTRLHVPDPAVNRVLQDLYDKLNQVAQSQALQNGPNGATPASPAPPARNLRRITKSYTLTGSDHTISANVQAVTSVLLPPSESVQGLGPFVIHNETGSGASISLGSARGELVGGIPATSHILAPGESLSVQPHPGYWITVGSGLGAGAAARAGAPTTAATPTVPATALTPSGAPAPGTFADAPVVTALPVPPDPLAVVGQYVTFNGVQYVFTAPLTGAGDGYWSRSAVNFVTISDTFANLGLYAAADYAPGSLFYATDVKVSYAVQVPSPTNVPTWLYYNGIWEDLLANIPAGLGVNDKNLLFRASDYLHNWLWTGTAWSLIAAAQIGFQGGLPPGTMVFANPGPPFGGTGALWNLCDGSTQDVSQEDASVVATVLPTIANTWFVR